MGGHRRPDRAHGVTDLATARRMRLAAATLYVVSGAREARRDLEGFLESVLGAGADIVQLREKDADVRDLLRWGAVFRRGARARDALFIVNDRPDVALAVGADGVHLGQDDLPPRWARRVLGDDALIGLSTHSEEQLDAVPAEVDYVCVGPVHETPTKPERAATGLGFVRFAAARASRAEHPRPWFAIGGINGATLPAVVSAGATRVVVVRAVTEASDSAAAVRALQRVLGRDVG